MWALNPLIILPDLNLTLIPHDKLRFCIFSPLLFRVICLTQHRINGSDSLSDPKAFVAFAPRGANGANSPPPQGVPRPGQWKGASGVVVFRDQLPERRTYDFSDCIRAPWTATTGLLLQYSKPPSVPSKKKFYLEEESIVSGRLSDRQPEGEGLRLSPHTASL